MRSGRTLDSTVSSVTRLRSHDPTDGGRTWSTPVRISTHNETQAFTPAIRVDAQGNIGVTYYDFRNDNPNTTRTRY